MIVTCSFSEEILVPKSLKASKLIYDTVKIPFSTRQLQQLPLLADGYALISGSHHYSQETIAQFLHVLIQHQKTIIIDNVHAATGEIVRAFYQGYGDMVVIEVKDQHASIFDPYKLPEYSPSIDHVFVILPHSYIRRKMLRHHAKASSPSTVKNTSAQQSIHILGIIPFNPMLTPKTITLMTEAPLVVTFDSVYEHIKNVDLQGEIHLVEYDWERYQVNIDRINQKLRQLHIQGYYDVVLVVEGNPEVYDLLAYLESDQRIYRFEVVAPMVVLCCAWITQHFGIDVTELGYVILSSHHMRHGMAVQHLASELEAYLHLDITCLVIELYSGNLPLIFKQAFASERLKTIIIMINMFTPEQQIFTLSSKTNQSIKWVEHIKGQFTNIAIVDQELLQRKPSGYTKLLESFTPEQSQYQPGS